MSFKTIVQIAALLSLHTAKLIADDGLPNPSARPITQPQTFAMSVQSLYWQPTENVDWAYTLHNSPNTTQTDYQVFVFNWAPGFRVGLGYNMEYDRWDTQAFYTWFQSKASGAKTGPITPGFFAARLSDLEPFSKGRANIHLQYNMFDWDLGRAFLISNHLQIRPSIGVKAGWINQTVHSDWELDNVILIGTIFAKEDLKHHFIGAGPKGSLSTKWILGNSQKHFFSLIGAFEAGYLWGHWNIKDLYHDTLNTTISTITTPRNFASFTLHCFAGLGWDLDFNCDQSHLAIKVGYEIEDWFNHCQFFTNINGAQNNDLILQGLNINAGVDF